MDALDNLGLWFVVILISLIGVLNKLLYFKIGEEGRQAIAEHIPRLEPEQLESVERRYQEGGSRLLLLSSIPALGSAIAAAAGLFETPLPRFVLLVFISSLVRNILILIVAHEGVQYFSGS